MPEEPKNRYHLSEKSAQRIVQKSVEQIYGMKPFKFELSLTGSVDKLPVLHISCDSQVYDTYIDFTE